MTHIQQEYKYKYKDELPVSHTLGMEGKGGILLYIFLFKLQRDRNHGQLRCGKRKYCAFIPTCVIIPPFFSNLQSSVSGKG